MKKNKLNFPVKPLIPGAVIFIALALIAGYFWGTLKHLDYFKIRHVAVSTSGKNLGTSTSLNVNGERSRTIDFSYLLGRNIFSIDLKKESRYISGLYPVYNRVRLFRIPPDRLFVLFTERKAVAYVKLYRNFCIDSNRVLFDLEKGASADDLPLIVGLERKLHGPKPGKQNNINELIAALSIIKEMQADTLLRKYKIDKIDAAGAADITCFIRLFDYSDSVPLKKAGFLEVKMGQGNAAEKVHLLSGVFVQLKDDINNVKYIDLRFKEPVIKFKDAK